MNRVFVWSGLFLAFAVALRTGSHALSADSTAAQKMAAYVETIPGTDTKFELLPIPGGTFTMGSPDNEPNRRAERSAARSDVEAVLDGKD